MILLSLFWSTIPLIRLSEVPSLFRNYTQKFHILTLWTLFVCRKVYLFLPSLFFTHSRQLATSPLYEIRPMDPERNLHYPRRRREITTSPTSNVPLPFLRSDFLNLNSTIRPLLFHFTDTRWTHNVYSIHPTRSVSPTSSGDLVWPLHTG